jgi:hypothetical protein
LSDLNIGIVRTEDGIESSMLYQAAIFEENFQRYLFQRIGKTIGITCRTTAATIHNAVAEIDQRAFCIQTYALLERFAIVLGSRNNQICRDGFCEV